MLVGGLTDVRKRCSALPLHLAQNMASRPSPFQKFLEDFAYPEGSDFRELDSEGTEIIPMELPDTEETQIMQNKDETVSSLDR